MESKVRRDAPYLVGYALLIIAFYKSAIRELAAQWWNDPNFSHGFLIPVFSGYLIWKMRNDISWNDTGWNWGGLFLVSLGILSYFAGVATATEFLVRISLLLWIYGSVIFLFGRSCWRSLLFPLLFLLFMIPLPYLLYDQIAFPLKIAASNLAEAMLHISGIPAFREGNIISLPTMVLEVVDACSGIRSLISLLAIGCIVAYTLNKGMAIQSLVVVSAIPIAILTNSWRIYGTGVLAGMGYQILAEGFFHVFSGWLVFLSGLALILVSSKAASLLERRG